MKTYIKQISIALMVTVMFVSCNKDEAIETNTEFPDGIVSYNYPLGTTNIQGQSPISINTSTTEKMNTTDPVIHYNAITLSSVENTSENLKVSLSTTDKANNYITIKGMKYELQQFHFHRHSEHNVNGEYGTMEIHFVNKSQTGAYAVLGVVVKTGSVNSALQTLIEGSPKDKGINAMTNTFYLSSIMPSDTGKYYSYSGSLTTPNLDSTPNQGPVTWIVFKNNIQMTDDQLEDYANIYEDENFRAIQSLNSRTVYENIR
jgi:carbonic anhydrase